MFALLFAFAACALKPVLHTLPLPDDIQLESASYAPNGKIIFYNKTSETEYAFSIVDDDGSNLKMLWTGEIHQQKSNGIRIMPFWDNQRVLIGDAVLECYPSLEDCQKSAMIDIQYPTEIVNYSKTLFIWSEIVISQDSQVIGWTTLTYSSAIVLLGRLVRGTDIYTIKDVRVISSSQFTVPDPDHPGYIIPLTVRGGEIKQFVRGGTALTLAGSSSSGLAKSVFQDLLTEEVAALSHEPGYEETMIMSPDERLGLVMSPRFSPHTNCAIFGLLPRPYSTLALAGVISQAYQYSVTSVRAFKRPGNIGPVLVEVERSVNDKSYHGIGLYDENGDWMYESPMSWHPSSTKAAWIERNRTLFRRVRMISLPDYKPRDPVPTRATPIEEITYAQNISTVFPNPPETYSSGKIKGTVGYIDFSIEPQDDMVVTKLQYKNFSTDGRVFYNGEESATTPAALLSSGLIYKGGVTMTGEETGEMDFMVEFTQSATINMTSSYGYARYNGQEVRVEDMLE